KRELREKLFSKTFIIMTILLPVFMVGILALQTFLYSYEGDSDTNLKVIAQSPSLLKEMQNEFNKLDFIKSGYYKISFENINKSTPDDFIKKEKQKLLSEKLTGVIFIPDSALISKKVEYYSKNPMNRTLIEKVRPTINNVLVNRYFEGKDISDKDINYARQSVDFSSFRISSDSTVEQQRTGTVVVAFIFIFLLYISLIFTGQIMMRSVVSEKSNRIVEVLLSSADSKELMTGKIIGTSITGLIQMIIWMLPLILLVTTALFTLPPEFSLKLNMMQIGYFLLNYLIGLITFMGLFTSVGAIFDNEQDTQSGMWPIMMLIMIPFFIAISVVENSDTDLARISSMLPFASIIVMPARMVLTEVPVWQIVISFIVNIGTILILFPVAGKIYRVGILMSGKKPKWSEVAGWLRYKN
ncbi:MAG TPA: ABC transporter permease, partial [Ignavibacteriaceae bacterium]|nr:ABC transporter permease [Ignavibacteriaceae bacterium]